MNIEVGDILTRKSLGRIIKVRQIIGKMFIVDIIETGNPILKDYNRYDYYSLSVYYVKQPKINKYKIL